MVSRRAFLSSSVPAGILTAGAVQQRAFAIQSEPAPGNLPFVDILALPDTVTAFNSRGKATKLERTGSRFTASSIEVELARHEALAAVALHAPKTPLTHLHLRWKATLDESILCFGDAWERSYGELAWRGMEPERVMPWYCATHDGRSLNAYGVRTGAGALCFWQIDPEGLSLWADLRNGGEAVELGDRVLQVAVLVSRRGTAWESPLAAVRAFCRQMCPSPKLLEGPVYGVNDWYYAYGKNSEAMLLAMNDAILEAAPAAGPRPFTVVDDGWRDGSATFPSMAAFAEKIKAKGARPGAWIRPLIAQADSDPRWFLPAARFGSRADRTADKMLDPTIPEALDHAMARIRQLGAWGMEMVKHDYSTYDLFGQWGFEMGASPTLPGWHFADSTRTNAEIVTALYRAIREALGPKIAIIGCNTVGHLGAGIFEAQRTGDDTSGHDWERTRRMGVNTLAHRLAQHNTFFALDPDCVPITADIPWPLTRQWLDVVARSKTAMFLSIQLDSYTAEQKAAVREAVALACSTGEPAEPADLLHGTTPESWRAGASSKRYSWSGAEGASPFPL